MTLSSPAELKQALRREASRIRREQSARQGEAAARAIARAGADLALPPGTVAAGYWPLPGEIDDRPLLTALAARGAVLALPEVAAPDAPLVFRRWAPGDPLAPGPHRTFHPLPSAPPLRPTLLLVPVLGFDAKGFRLGFGGGYYDRTLAALRRDGGLIAVGLAYAAQQLPAVPVEPWDQALDAILTEEGLVSVVQA